MSRSLALVLRAATVASMILAHSVTSASASPSALPSGPGPFECETRPAALAPQPAVPPSLAANVLRFTFESPDRPWTDAELGDLRTMIDDLYPSLVEVYGTPAYDITVNIRKSGSNWYSPTTNEIGLAVPLHAPALCHELLHAFRDDAMIRTEAYEEGMAAAGTAAVLKGLDAYWTSSEWHAGGQSYYEQLNVPEIAGWGGAFVRGNPRLQLRYDMSDYAWSKPQLETGTFLADFNRGYYADLAARGAISWGPDEGDRLRAIARAAAPTVEGVDYDAWHERQHILDFWPEQGDIAMLQSECHEDAVASSVIIQAYARDGYESPLAGAPVRARVLSPDGAVIAEASGNTASNGAASFRIDLPPAYRSWQGRVALVASVTTPSGILEDTTYRSRGRERGVFGVVTDALDGEVTATHLASGTTETTTLTRGCFDLPSLELVSGRVRVTFRAPDGRTATRTFTKDRSPYYVALVAGPAAPGGTNLVRNPSFEDGTYGGWERYGSASLLRIVDGGHGPSGPCLEVVGGDSRDQLGINDHPNWASSTVAGRRYRVSAWVHAASTGGTSRVRIREYLDKVRVGDAVYSNRVTLSNRWQLLTLEYVARTSNAALDLQVVADPVVKRAAFQVDDIAIEPLPASTIPVTTAPDEGAGSQAAAHAPFRATLTPQPLTGRGELVFTTTRVGPLEVTLYDLGGRLVRTVCREASAAAGVHRVTLAREDRFGRRLPMGVCFYRVRATDGVLTGRVVIAD